MRVDKKGQELYKKFGSEKIIIQSKDRNFEIKFMKSYIWIYPLVIVVGVLLNIPMILMILSNFQKLIAGIIFFVFCIITAIVFLSQKYLVYFEENYLIIKNIFKIKVFDLNKYPRIYIRQRIYNNSYDKVGRIDREIETYDLYIEQGNVSEKFDIGICGYDKIESFINNLEMRTKQECSEEQWSVSRSDRERQLLEYRDFLDNQGKIIGVKKAGKRMTINKRENFSFYILFIPLVLLIIFEIFLLSVKEYVSFWLILVGVIINIGALIVKYNTNIIKISYSDESIKIDKYRLRYKESDIKIAISASQMPYFSDKYIYNLLILGTNSEYSIYLGNAKQSDVGKFIDNIYFENNNH